MLIVTMKNISALAPVSDYEYVVYVTTQDGRQRILEQGYIKSHTRADGWRTLLRRLVWDDERESQP